MSKANKIKTTKLINKLSAIAVLGEIKEREICWYPAHREVADAFSDKEKEAFDIAIMAIKRSITNE